MKKNIEYASLSSSLTRWLIERLKETRLEGAEELRNQFIDLESRKCNSLILERNQVINNESYVEHFVYKELEIIPKYRKVMVDGKDIILTPKEYDILYFLASNQGEIFTKEQIYRAVWDNEYLMDDSNIMSFIRKLRKKIEPNPDAPKFIITVWGIGYKFNDK